LKLKTHIFLRSKRNKNGDKDEKKTITVNLFQELDMLLPIG